MPVTRPITLPNSHVQVVAPPAELDFFHTRSVRLERPVTPLEAWNAIMSHRMPLMKLAFRIRDTISALFGVKRLGGFSNKRVETVSIGDRLDFFLVEGVSPHALTMTERDRHLDVMTCVSTEGEEVTITSSVKTHNAFGRAYMLPVGLAHRLIVARMLERLRRETTARPAPK